MTGMRRVSELSAINKLFLPRLAYAGWKIVAVVRAECRSRGARGAACIPFPCYPLAPLIHHHTMVKRICQVSKSSAVYVSGFPSTTMMMTLMMVIIGMVVPRCKSVLGDRSQSNLQTTHYTVTLEICVILDAACNRNSDLPDRWTNRTSSDTGDNNS
jgi:hypothetical protein